MITLIHGDDTLASYQRLSERISQCRHQGLAVITRDASELNTATLRQEAGATDLFGARSCLVIKGLLSGPKSKQKETVIAALQELDHSELLLYEPKKLTDSLLKQLPQAKVETLNVNPVIFKFLDSLRPGNIGPILRGWTQLLGLGHQPDYVFAMITRQIRLLIQAKSGPSYLTLSAYPKRLITAQAGYFTLAHLLNLHGHLYQADKRLKTGLSPLPLEQLLLQFFYSL